MKPDWDKLGNQYKDSDSVMIVDVDCTAGGQSVCQKHGVKGYPTIKYFRAGQKSGTAYQGGRDFSSLANFVKTTLDKGPACDPLTGKGCKPIQKKFIEANEGKSLNELEDSRAERKTAFDELKKSHKAAEKEFKAAAKEFKKSEKKFKLADDILKALIKDAKKNGRDEL